MADEPAQIEEGPHPLQFKWSLWHDFTSLKSKNTPYAANLRLISSFETVEEFWGVFNSLKEPSLLPNNHTYNLFKSGIVPKWEDEQNQNGGEWRSFIPTSRSEILDECWVNTVLTVIGEGFGPSESDDIAGVVMNRKRGGYNRVAIWTKSASDEDLQMRIGQRWRDTSGMSTELKYLVFQDQLSSHKKMRARYSV